MENKTVNNKTASNESEKSEPAKNNENKKLAPPDIENPDISNHENNDLRQETERRKKKKRLIIFSVSVFILTLAAVVCLIFLPDALVKGVGLLKIKKKAGTITGIVAIYALLLLTAVVLYVSKLRKKESAAKFFTTKNITRTAVFSALSIVLYYFVKFPLPAVFPSFLDIQFADLPALLAGYMMGPLSGAIVIIIKCIVKLPASGTMFVGEAVDVILGLSFVIPSSIIYRRKRNIKWAALSLTIGSLICTVVAALANRFIAVPAYLALMFDGNWNILLGAMNKIFNGKVTENNFYLYFIFLSVIPFNLLRCLITSVLTFLSYKSLKKLFDRMAA